MCIRDRSCSSCSMIASWHEELGFFARQPCSAWRAFLLLWAFPLWHSRLLHPRILLVTCSRERLSRVNFGGRLTTGMAMTAILKSWNTNGMLSLSDVKALATTLGIATEFTALCTPRRRAILLMKNYEAVLSILKGEDVYKRQQYVLPTKPPSMPLRRRRITLTPSKRDGRRFSLRTIASLTDRTNPCLFSSRASDPMLFATSSRKTLLGRRLPGWASLREPQ